MAIEGRVMREGLVAGLIGAATVAVWILLFDSVNGVPLRSPATLGAVIFQGLRDPSVVTITVGNVLGYTVIHGLAFIAFGIAAAFLVASAEPEPAMVIALLIFFLAFEVFFLALVVFLAQPILGVVAWWAILIGNFLAAVSMLTYFFSRHRRLAETILGGWAAVARNGVMAGLLGGAVVVLWFFCYDTLRFQQPLRTPAILGSAVFEGLRNPATLQIGFDVLDVVLGYTVLHFTVFAVIGVIVATLLAAAEREPRILLGLFILFWCFEIFFLGFLSVLDEALVGALLWWNVAIANLLADVVMLGYFFTGHRSLGARLLERWSED